MICGLNLQIQILLAFCTIHFILHINLPSKQFVQDEQSENLPSDGEILHDCRPITEDAALLEVLKPRYSEAPASVVRTASPTQRKPMERYRSMGEVSIGEALPARNFEEDVHLHGHHAKRLGSSDGEQLISRQSSGEFQADLGLSTGEVLIYV